MNTANIMNKIQAAKKFVHILMMFIINEQKENMNGRASFLQRSYESSHFLTACAYSLQCFAYPKSLFPHFSMKRHHKPRFT